MKKKLIAFAAALLTTASCASYTVTIPEAKLNQNLKRKFPVRKSYSLISAKLFNPQIKLLGKGEAEIKLNYELNLAGVKKLTGNLNAIGKVLYDPKAKTVYLTKLQIEKLKILNGQLLKGETAQIINRLLREELRKIPIYRFKGTKAQLIKAIKVEKGKLLIQFGV
jgi:hypothetical protein